LAGVAEAKDIAIEDQIPFLGEDWFDALETGVRRQIRSFIEEMLEAELEAALGRGPPPAVSPAGLGVGSSEITPPSLFHHPCDATCKMTINLVDLIQCREKQMREGGRHAG
jgi:hypothetical protein